MSGSFSSGLNANVHLEENLSKHEESMSKKQKEIDKIVAQQDEIVEKVRNEVVVICDSLQDMGTLCHIEHNYKIRKLVQVPSSVSILIEEDFKEMRRMAKKEKIEIQRIN